MAEAGVALPAVGVEDPQRRAPPGWTGAVARDDHLRSLADDVSSEPDPRSTGQLEADPGCLADRGIEAPWASARRLEHHERDPGSTGERRNPGEPIAESHLRNAVLPGRQVDDQQVHRPTRKQRAGNGEALLRVVGRQDDEPLRLHPAGHGLHGIERRREVQPGHDRPRGLGLRGEPQGQRRPPARDVAPDREAHPARHAAGAEDRIELGEAGRMHPIETDRRPACRLALRVRLLEWDRRERPDDLADEAGRGRPEPIAGKPGRSRTPARSKGRQRRVQVGRGSTHGAASIEQMFE